MSEGIKDIIINYPIIIVISLAIFSLIFIMVGHRFRDNIQLALKQPIIDLPGTTVDWWSVSHFLLFAIFGFIMPGRVFTLIGLGIGWELIEDYLSSDHSTQLSDCREPTVINSKGEIVRKFWCNGIQDGYWYGKWDDIVFNTFGYICGQRLRELVGW